MAESRTELIAWINDLLQTKYTKIEQLGTGAAYCQIMDSIYGDVQMSKVKFDAKMEYEYVNNFKILQSCFEKHRVDKPLLVTKLVKCKMQDNLEFTQWLKKFWDSYYPGGEYDALARRANSSSKLGTPSPQSTSRSPNTLRPSSSATNRDRSVNRNPSGRSSRMSENSNRTYSPDPQSTMMLNNLSRQIAEMRVTIDGLEKERDFYFQKLRQVEVLVQTQLDKVRPQSNEAFILNGIQQILYSTDDGQIAEEQLGEGDEEVF